MHEIVPGIYHWSTFHAPIRSRVSSYFIAPAGIVIDPKIPETGIESLPGRPEQIVLTIGLHDRDAGAFAETFGTPIRVPREGMERVRGVFEATPYQDGDELAAGVRAIAIGHLAPDEYALHIEAGEGALSFADGLINSRGLGFVPDSLMGPDPEAVKRGLIGAFAGLLELRFDALLFAHGDPVASGGHAALRAFVTD